MRKSKLCSSCNKSKQGDMYICCSNLFCMLCKSKFCYKCGSTMNKKLFSNQINEKEKPKAKKQQVKAHLSDSIANYTYCYGCKKPKKKQVMFLDVHYYFCVSCIRLKYDQSTSKDKVKIMYAAYPTSEILEFLNDFCCDCLQRSDQILLKDRSVICPDCLKRCDDLKYNQISMHFAKCHVCNKQIQSKRNFKLTEYNQMVCLKCQQKKAHKNTMAKQKEKAGQKQKVQVYKSSIQHLQGFKGGKYQISLGSRDNKKIQQAGAYRKNQGSPYKITQENSYQKNRLDPYSKTENYSQQKHNYGLYPKIEDSPLKKDKGDILKKISDSSKKGQDSPYLNKIDDICSICNKRIFYESELYQRHEETSICNFCVKNQNMQFDFFEKYRKIEVPKEKLLNRQIKDKNMREIHRQGGQMELIQRMENKLQIDQNKYQKNSYGNKRENLRNKPQVSSQMPKARRQKLNIRSRVVTECIHNYKGKMKIQSRTVQLMLLKTSQQLKFASEEKSEHTQKIGYKSQIYNYNHQSKVLSVGQANKMMQNSKITTQQTHEKSSNSNKYYYAQSPNKKSQSQSPNKKSQSQSPNNKSQSLSPAISQSPQANKTKSSFQLSPSFEKQLAEGSNCLKCGLKLASGAGTTNGKGERVCMSCFYGYNSKKNEKKEEKPHKGNTPYQGNTPYKGKTPYQEMEKNLTDSPVVSLCIRCKKKRNPQFVYCSEFSSIRHCYAYSSLDSCKAVQGNIQTKQMALRLNQYKP